MRPGVRLQSQNTESNHLRDWGMRSDMMAYDIWIVVASILETVLDLEVSIKFLNSNHISQTASGFQTQCQAAWDIGKDKTACGTTLLLGNLIKFLLWNTYWPGTSVTRLGTDANIYPVRSFHQAKMHLEFWSESCKKRYSKCIHGLWGPSF